MNAFSKLFTASGASIAILSLLLIASQLAIAVPTGAANAVPAIVISAVPAQLGHKRHTVRQRLANFSPAERTVIADAIALERLYRRGGKLAAVNQLYLDLLKRTQNPALQNFAQRRLAKLAAGQGDLKSAEAHLRASLDAGLNQF
jgi:hypothetical protein